MAAATKPVRLYDTPYGGSASTRAGSCGLETYGEDLAQNGWLTASGSRATVHARRAP